MGGSRQRRGWRAIGVAGALVCAAAGPGMAQDRPPATAPSLAIDAGNWLDAVKLSAAVGGAPFEGRIAFTLAVTPQGRASGCTLNSAIGMPDLEAEVCRQLIETARFLPKLDDAGRPIAHEYSNAIRMTLPEDGAFLRRKLNDRWFPLLASITAGKPFSADDIRVQQAFVFSDGMDGGAQREGHLLQDWVWNASESNYTLDQYYVFFPDPASSGNERAGGFKATIRDNAGALCLQHAGKEQCLPWRRQGEAMAAGFPAFYPLIPGPFTIERTPDGFDYVQRDKAGQVTRRARFRVEQQAAFLDAHARLKALRARYDAEDVERERQLAIEERRERARRRSQGGGLSGFLGALAGAMGAVASGYSSGGNAWQPSTRSDWSSRAPAPAGDMGVAVSRAAPQASAEERARQEELARYRAREQAYSGRTLADPEAVGRAAAEETRRAQQAAQARRQSWQGSAAGTGAGTVTGTGTGTLVVERGAPPEKTASGASGAAATPADDEAARNRAFQEEVNRRLAERLKQCAQSRSKFSCDGPNAPGAKARQE